MNLQEYIQKIPQSRVAFIGNRCKYTYEDLKILKNANWTTIEKLKGANIVINGRKRLEFALLLSILDSYVAKILFLPQDIDKKLHKEFYKKAKIHYEVYLENNHLKYRVVDNYNTADLINQYETEWIIPTSGTTNTPKLVSHSFESLTKSTKCDIEQGGKYRWGLVFDIYRFSGIQVFLQSLLSGSTLIFTEPSESMAQMLSTLAVNNCNALSATPSFWRKVLMTKEADKLSLIRVTLGGEIADQNILQALHHKYPDAKITHIYASTEVGVGFSVTDGKEGFPKEYMDGGLLSIKMKIDKQGLLWIAPEKKGQKYLSGDSMFDEDGYINTGDLVEERDGRIYFLGRDSGAINVGGNKVQPEEVEKILLSHKFVCQVQVYPVKNPMMGSLVYADIVLCDKSIDEKEARKDILQFSRKHLDNFKVPAMIKFVDEIQISYSGKVRRKKL